MARYALTIFLSAFLLFQVQPLMGKHLLPAFGGGPAVWTTCMLFFQALLLGGYLYAHLLSGLSRVRRQGLVHLLLLMASLAMLAFVPMAPHSHRDLLSGASPSARILLLLLLTIGGPYFILSTTGPLMQRWFSRSFPGRSPYRLYALSNFGSLLALLSYPFVVEPTLRLRTQDSIWSWSYAVFAALAAWCCFGIMRLKNEPVSERLPGFEPDPAVGGRAPRPGAGRMFLWLGLAAMGSALLLSTTNQLCMNVAVVPFLWVLPLSLYLLTFVICFDNPRWYDRRVFGLLLALAAGGAYWILEKGIHASVPIQVGVYSAVMFAGCMACHGELTLSRPHPRHLTLFYLLVSAGGVLGGLFVAIAAPLLFKGFWEYPIALGGACLLTLIAWRTNRVEQGGSSLVFWLWALGSAAQAAFVLALLDRSPAERMSDEGLLILCSVYGVLVLIGWMGTVIWENRPRALGHLWCDISAALAAWVIVFSQWRGSDMLPAGRYIWLIPGMLAAAPVCLLLAALSKRLSETWRLFVRIAVIQASFLMIMLVLIRTGILDGATAAVIAGLYAVVLCILILRRNAQEESRLKRNAWLHTPLVGALAVFLALLLSLVREDARKPTYVSRNFYGVLRVVLEKDSDGEYYSLKHGQIEHGLQYLEGHLRYSPTTYYGEESGIGLAIRFHPRHANPDPAERNLRVGVVGLGTGATAVYGRSGDYYRFYEINPDVAELSNLYFTYLKDSKAEIQIAFGDARMEMERELEEGRSQQFDILAIDAFNSDAIPVHLITSECVEVYRRHLKPDGLLLFHISNRYLDLNPVVRALAEQMGWRAVRVENEGDDDAAVYESTWVIVTSNEAFLARPEVEDASSPWTSRDPAPLLWTDDFAGLWQVLEEY